MASAEKNCVQYGCLAWLQLYALYVAVKGPIRGEAPVVDIGSAGIVIGAAVVVRLSALVVFGEADALSDEECRI